MREVLGQSVLNCKAIPSLDGGLPLGHNVRMAESETEAEYKQRFMERVALARISRGWKQWQAGEALGMSQDKYKQYESRSLMPHHLIGRFCLVCRVDPEWLITGRGKKPIKPLQEVATEPQDAPLRAAAPKKARKRRAA